MEDKALRPLILDPFDYQGVDTLDASSVVLLLRIRTVGGCRVGLAPTGKRRLVTAHTQTGPCRQICEAPWFNRSLLLGLACAKVVW
jgi:hypothetical protein